MEVEVRGLWKGQDGTVYGYCMCGREVKNRVNLEASKDVSGSEKDVSRSSKESIEDISESVKESRDDILRCPMCKATLIWPKFDEKSL